MENRKLVWKLETPNSRYLQDTITKKIIGRVVVEGDVSGVNYYRALVGTEANPIWVKNKIKGLNNAKAQVECRIHQLGEDKVIESTKP